MPIMPGIKCNSGASGSATRRLGAHVILTLSAAKGKDLLSVALELVDAILPGPVAAVLGVIRAAVTASDGVDAGLDFVARDRRRARIAWVLAADQLLESDGVAVRDIAHPLGEKCENVTLLAGVQRDRRM